MQVCYGQRQSVAIIKKEKWKFREKNNIINKSKETSKRNKK